MSTRKTTLTCLLVLFAAFGLSAAEPQSRLNVPYAGEDSRALQKLDIYRPAGEAENLPIVIYVHGGGWAIGDKKRVQNKPSFFTERGYLFISVNYRLSPAVQHPEHVKDVIKAIAWVHEHANVIGGDPDRIALIGHSAGAHLVALAAVDEDLLKEEGLTLGAVKAVIPLDGAGYDIPTHMKTSRAVAQKMYRRAFGEDEKGWIDASPLHQIDDEKSYPAFLLIHAGRRAASRERSEDLAEKLKSAGGTAELLSAPDRDHGSLNRRFGDEDDPYTAKSLKFIEKHLNTNE